MTFALDNDPDNREISESINYLLANLPVGLTQNIATGQVTNSLGIVVSYIYQYIDVKFAQSFDGTVGFSNVPANATYYGLRNSDSPTESLIPSQYKWYLATFGTTNNLYYSTTGGRQIQFSVAALPINSNWRADPLSAINLDLITSTSPTINNSGVTIIGLDGEDGNDGVPGPQGIQGIQGNPGMVIYLEPEVSEADTYFMPGPSASLGGYLVASLPIAGLAGRRAHVTNALAPVFGAAVIGGGAVVIPVFDNGTTWIVG